MNQEEVVRLMESSQSKGEWRANADKVKESCNGYPGFWFPVIFQSGLADRVSKTWGGDADIHASTHP